MSYLLHTSFETLPRSKVRSTFSFWFHGAGTTDEAVEPPNSHDMGTTGWHIIGGYPFFANVLIIGVFLTEAKLIALHRFLVF